MLRRFFKDTHWPFVISIVALSAIGILFIHSAVYYESGRFAVKQSCWVFLGLLVFLFVSRFSYRNFVGVSYLLYVVSLLLLAAVLVFGLAHSGAQRWLHLGPLVLQPSEFAKLATVLALANYLGSHPSWESGAHVLMVVLAMVAAPILLIVKQPDLGTSLLFIPLILVALFLWGIRYRYLITAGILGFLGIPLLWMGLKEYQKKRILVFLNPDLEPLGVGYTALQSRIAIGSGGFFGKGYLAGTQGQLEFVPEHHTDFIFCLIGEEWGYLGSLLLLVLYGVLFSSCFRVIQSTTDMKAKLLAGGVVTLLFTQVFINIGMSFGLMPITGLTLPLISYGGSSFVATAVSLGLILSIYRERSIF